MTYPTITACLIIHNEQAILADCLDSIKGVVDEIVVVHDGPCSDKSLDIARTYGAKVFVQPAKGSSEFHRVFSYQQATSDWILQVDADEKLSPALHHQLRQLVANPKADAYALSWPPTNGQHHIGRAFAHEIRYCLLRRSAMYFIGLTHEFPKTTGHVIERPDLELEHLPKYNNFTWQKLRTKWFKWTRLQAAQILDFPRLDTYHIDDITTTWEYHFYARQVRHPFIMALRFSKNTGLKVIKDAIAHPLQPDYWSWKIGLLHCCNYYYLAWSIATRKSAVDSAQQWWSKIV